MGMAREPSAALQDEFAQATEMPFRDSQKGVKLQQILDMALRGRARFAPDTTGLESTVSPAAAHVCPTLGRDPGRAAPHRQKVLERAERPRDAGVVDEHVEAAVRGDDRRHDAPACLGVGDVEPADPHVEGVGRCGVT